MDLLMALDAVKLTIRDRGDKISFYTPAQLRAQAEAMLGPWLILKAKERIAMAIHRALQIKHFRCT
jgi:hypothetical protein